MDNFGYSRKIDAEILIRFINELDNLFSPLIDMKVKAVDDWVKAEGNVQKEKVLQDLNSEIDKTLNVLRSFKNSRRM